MCRMNESVAEPHVEDVMGSVLPRMQFESHAQKKKKKKTFVYCCLQMYLIQEVSTQGVVTVATQHS